MCRRANKDAIRSIVDRVDMLERSPCSSSRFPGFPIEILRHPTHIFCCLVYMGFRHEKCRLRG